MTNKMVNIICAPYIWSQKIFIGKIVKHHYSIHLLILLGFTIFSNYQVFLRANQREFLKIDNHRNIFHFLFSFLVLA